MPQYRIAFFNLLKSELEKYDVELSVVYGKSYSLDRGDEIDLEWAYYRKNKIFSFLKFVIYWQPTTDLIKGKDLVIVEQANSLLINYYLIILRFFTKLKIGFWGHGRNRQGSGQSILNKFKLAYLKKCDYWFAYTKSVQEYLILNGFGQNKISVVNNSLDTHQLKTDYFSIDEKEVEFLRSEFSIASGDSVAIYCGALYKEKRLDFLLSAAVLVKQKLPGFNLLIVGAGPDENKLKSQAKADKWIHFVGSKFGREKAKFFKAADIFVMPGALGLAALDSFVTQTPMVIPQLQTHGPEIDYLVHDINCIITSDNVAEFAKESIKLLTDKNKIEKLKTGCEHSAEEFTLDKMVTNFTEGVIKCLNNESR